MPPGSRHARDCGIATEMIPHGAFATQVGFENAIDRTLHEHGIAVVCLAGFMRVLSPWFVERWRDRLLNIHPSLLPAFRGLDTHRRVLAAGVRFTGCTVHLRARRGGRRPDRRPGRGAGASARRR